MDVCACVHACVHACMNACMCVCVFYLFVFFSLFLLFPPHTFCINLSQSFGLSYICNAMLFLLTESSSDNLALLQEALVVFREIRRGHRGQGSTPADDFDLNCEMMAALMFLQNAEAEQYLSDFPTEVCGSL